MVNRLAINSPDKIVFYLDSMTCPCSTMYRIHPAYLLWMLYGLLEGKVNNEITPCRTTSKRTPKSPWNGCCRLGSSRRLLPTRGPATALAVQLRLSIHRAFSESKEGLS